MSKEEREKGKKREEKKHVEWLIEKKGRKGSRDMSEVYEDGCQAR